MWAWNVQVHKIKAAMQLSFYNVDIHIGWGRKRAELPEKEGKLFFK